MACGCLGIAYAGVRSYTVSMDRHGENSFNSLERSTVQDANN